MKGILRGWPRVWEARQQIAFPECTCMCTCEVNAPNPGILDTVKSQAVSKIRIRIRWIRPDTAGYGSRIWWQQNTVKKCSWWDFNPETNISGHIFMLRATCTRHRYKQVEWGPRQLSQHPSNAETGGKSSLYPAVSVPPSPARPYPYLIPYPYPVPCFW